MRIISEYNNVFFKLKNKTIYKNDRFFSERESRIP